jgi:AcrR family transcriptional regulator
MPYGGGMPPKPAAREKILDAFESLLLDSGDRAATLDAVVERAGVSKGGLLYHFKNKEALASGLLARLLTLADADTDAMRTDPAGASVYYVRESAYEDTPLDRALIAVIRLAQASNAEARAMLSEIHHAWFELIRAEVADPSVARAIMLMGDGLYFNATLGSGVAGAAPVAREATADLLRVVEALKRLRA